MDSRALSQASGESKASGDGKSGFSFSCSATDSSYFTTILGVLQMDKDKQAQATFLVTEDGIKVTVEKDRILQASAYMKSTIFQEYKIGGGDDADREFRVDLDTLLNCLRVFGDASHLKLVYGGLGEDIFLILENKGVITECSVRTLEGAKPTDFSFRSSAILNQVGLSSKLLRECLQELDIPGASTMEVVMAPSSPHLSFKVTGNSVTCSVDFPNDESSEVFDQFDCKEYASNNYNMTLIRMCARSLSKMTKPDKTIIQMNEQGMLKLQHVVRAKSDIHFISYLVSKKQSPWRAKSIVLGAPATVYHPSSSQCLFYPSPHPLRSQ